VFYAALQENPIKLPPHWHLSGILSRDFSTEPPPLPEGDEIRNWLEATQVWKKNSRGVGDPKELWGGRRSLTWLLVARRRWFLQQHLYLQLH
jgi:hypothetical protein